MFSDLDVPNLPFKKPNSLVALEKLDRNQREAMDVNEIRERIRDAADGVAHAYKKNVKGGDYEGCALVVASALSETGGSLGGKMGAKMVGLSEEEARRACLEVYPEPE